jgi:FOG: WD40-like repeat
VCGPERTHNGLEPQPQEPTVLLLPSGGDERVVFGGRDKRLHCVQRSDGKEIWSFPTRRKVDGSPVIVGEKVVFGSGDGWMFVLSPERDGSEL